MSNDLAANILEADDLQLAEVDCPEWDCKVHVCTMNARDQNRIASKFAASPEGEFPEDLYVTLVVMCACDGEGNKLFHASDAEKLQEKSGAAVQRIAEAAMEINGFGDSPEALAEKN